ncbi:MAG: membrane protein insertion efficiency factor YidD [Bacteroidetes bacterium]|nr:membrane protein insertion efficiency factor YidD [Bacteroidota bacterium]MBU1423198.1 membrane protein insertion efficiency factor YidD [Bacteroidota bacterium]
MNVAAIYLIKIYRTIISPLLPPNTCRFFPTCSAYSLEAFQKFRFFKASWLAIKRIGRCHPFNEGGHDPLP